MIPHLDDVKAGIQNAERVLELHKRAVAVYLSRQTPADDHLPLNIGGLQIGVWAKHIIVLDGTQEVYDWVVPSTHKHERQTRVNLELLPRALDVLRQLMVLDDLANV